MPGAPMPDVISSWEDKPVTKDLEQAEQASEKSRNSPLHWLRTGGCVVCVAAAGLILYYLLAGRWPTALLSPISTSGQPVTVSLIGSSPALHTTGLGAPPKGDHRLYQHTVLDNGLQVVNVQDKRAVQTAFAMAVQAGSFDDPKKLPGLAHFCEHMLFLGTEKYPEASGFDNFMSANGGFNNAYTADEVTVYYGELSQAAGKEGLDRFADFFRAPLFDTKYVSKEVHAIDSEHAKNVQDPMRRILEVAFVLASEGSPVGSFHTGNAETLFDHPKKEGVDTVGELKTYFHSHYCPEKMRLVTYGSESLEEQLAGVTKEFSSLAAKDDSCKAPRKSFANPAPFGKDRMGRFVNVVGTLPQAELWVHWSLPDVTKEYKSQPLQYMEHVLGYSGEDSLVRVLQDNLGLVSSLQPMFDTSSAGTNLFVIAKLTEPGQNNVELVLDVLYSYLSGLRKKSVDEKLYQSLARINKLKWDWAEPSTASSTASDLAERMTRLPAKKLLSGDTLIEKPDSKLVSSLIDMLEPANMNVIFVAAAVKDFGNILDDFKTLPYYGVKYRTELLDQVVPGAADRWAEWLTGDSVPELGSRLPADLVKTGTADPLIPEAIVGVPKDIPLLHMKASKEKGNRDSELYGIRPKRIKHAELLEGAGETLDKGLEVYYRSGWATNSPKVNLQLTLKPVKDKDAKELPLRDGLRLNVFSSLFAERLVPKMVDLVAAGVSYGVDVGSNGLTFTFSGFMPLVPQVITKVLKEFNAFNGNANATDPARYKRVTEEMRQTLATFSGMPVSYAMQDRNILLLRGAFSRKESLAALDSVTRENAASSVDSVLLSQPLHMTSLAMGNVEEKEASDSIFKVVSGVRFPKGLKKTLKPASEYDRVTPVVKILRPVEVRSKNPRPGDPNDAVVLSLMAGQSSVRSRVILGIIGQVLSTVAYNELRTARQLGYVVSAGTSQISNVQYISCIVQGNALKADAVEGAIEHVYLHLLPKRLAELTDKEFAAYKDSFRQTLMKPPEKFQDEVGHFWGPVNQGGQCFDLRSNMVNFLEKSLNSKDLLIKEWDKLANPAEGVRKKIVIKYFADKVPPRPTEDEAAATFSKQGVPGSAVSLLKREYKKTRVLDKVDSKIRDQLVQEGGHYGRELGCDLEPSKGPAPSPHFLKPTSRHTGSTSVGLSSE